MHEDTTKLVGYSNIYTFVEIFKVKVFLKMALDGTALKKAQERTSTATEMENKCFPKKQNGNVIPANLRVQAP